MISMLRDKMILKITILPYKDNKNNPWYFKIWFENK